jgi:2-dehydro-3-deoxy-D-gluconate 5-dehydrogenase
MTEVIQAWRGARELVDLGGKAALVTGAAQGFGFACARRLAEAGAAVLLVDRNGEGAEAAARRLDSQGLRSAAAQGDVSVETDVEALVRACVERFGRLDILVNNAAVYSNYRFELLPRDELERVLAVNVAGAYTLSQHAARQMIEQADGGSIVNITSIDALHPTSVGMSHYTLSKHALWGLTKCLALELGQHRIRTNAIAPGPSLTEGAIAYIEDGAPSGIDIRAQWEQASQRVPLRRWADPDEIGRAAVYLASELASYVNGAQLVVDGGYLLGW